MANPQLWLAYGQSPSAPENPGHVIVTDLAKHIYQSDLAIQTDMAISCTCGRLWDMGSRVHGKAAAFVVISLKFWRTSDPHPRESDMETQLGYSWLSCSFYSREFPGQWLKLGHNWDLPILSRMYFLNIYKVNFDKLRLIMDVSFQPWYSSRVTNNPLKCSVSNGSGFGPDPRFGSVPDPSKKPKHTVLVGLVPGPDINLQFFGQVYHTAKPHFRELSTLAPIKYLSCNRITIWYTRKR